MADRVLAPIIVGITGKRDLNGKDEVVRTALSTALDVLDEYFPLSPKILLSALARGAGTRLGAELLKPGRSDKQGADRASFPARLNHS